MERQSTRKLFKLVIALVALFTLALSVFAFGACGGEEHKHEYTGSNKTEANCGKIGVETFTCSCGDTYVAVTPATGSHKWGADGYCETCGLPNFGAKDPVFPTIPDGFTAEDLAAIQKAITDSQKGITDAQQAAHNALGQKIDGLHSVHTFSTDNVKTLTMSGSCTTYGVKFTLSTCDVCKATFLTAIEKDGKLGHTPDGEGKIVVEPTCQQFGSWQQTCTVCGEIINERTLNTVPHEKGPKSETESIPATCTEPGTDKYECKWCHVVQFEWNETVKALGHAGKPAPKDCTKDEDLSWHCDVCNTNVTEKYTAGTHTFGEAVEVTTNCADNKEGVTVTKTCSVCGFEEVTKKGASGTHVAYTDEETTTIYVLLGEKNANWNKFKTEHPEASDPANLKTTAEDYSADNNVVKYTYYICKTCGKPVQKAAVAECHNFALNTEAESFKGHKVVDGKPAQECLDYTVEYKCLDTNCNASYTEVVKGAEHKLSAADWDENTGKGQLSAGWTVKLGADGKPLNATCTTKGTAYRYCTVCCVNAKGEFDSTKANTENGNYEEHEISEAPHTIKEIKASQAPTCTEDGWYEGPCATCGATTRETWAAEGHVFGAWKRVYGTNGDDACQSAHEAKYCRNCDAVEYREADSRYDHQWRLEVVNPNTCTKDGWGRDVCDRCGDAGTYHPIPAEHLLSLDVSGMTTEEITALIVKYVRPIWLQVEYDKSDFWWNECLGSWLGNAKSGTLSIAMGVLGNCTNRGGIYHICFRDGCPNGYEIEESKQYNYRDGQCYYGVVTHKVDCSQVEAVEAACQFCGKTKTFTLKPVEHKWAATASKTNLVDDCTEGVYDLFECTVCQQTKKEYHKDSAADHTVPTTDKPVTTYVPFSYAEGGLKAWNEFVEAFKAEHTDVDVPEIANYEVGSDGYKAYHNTIRFTYYVCTVCHQTIMEAVAEKHSFVVGQPGEKEFQFKTDAEGNPIPDCVTPYTVTWACTDTDCQASYTETIAPAGHKWKQVASKEPTCTEEGEGYEYCEVCNPEAKKDAKDVKGEPTYKEGKLAKTEHKWVEMETILPTCKDAGSIGYECSVCGTTKSEPIPATGEHNFEESEWSEWINDPEHPAHLTQPGKQYRYRECWYLCGEREYEYRDYTGNGDHAWLTDADGNVTWFLDQLGNCTTPSTYHKVCMVCGMTVSVNGPAPVGHKWGADVEIPATCTSNGMVYHECTVCGEQQIVKYLEKLGHLYYKDLTRDQVNALKDVAPDELRTHLNIVGESESSCLAPESVTVECVDCGARYSWSNSGTKGEGHTWILIPETLNENVLCGNFLNSKTLAYCEQCGLVIELTEEMGWDFVTDTAKNEIVFNDSPIYAKYIKVEKGLNFVVDGFLDKNSNLCLKVDGKVLTDENGKLDSLLTSLVVAMFQDHTKIQMHEFDVKKGATVLPILEGTCTKPSAYIVLCAYCGGTAEKPTIKLDSEIKVANGETYWNLVDAFKKNYEGSVKDAYTALGYSNFSKNALDHYTVKLEGDDVAKEYSSLDLYQKLVAAYLATYEKGKYTEAFEDVKDNVRYSGFNFTQFHFDPEGHEYLLQNEICEVDPLLTFIYEDYFGLKGVFFSKGTNNLDLAGGDWYKVTKDGKQVWRTLGEMLEAKKGDERFDAAALKVTYAEWLDTSFGDYEAVIDYLTEKGKPASRPTLPEGYLGISNWCMRAAEGKDICDLPNGFKASVAHNFLYQIAKDPTAEKPTYYDAEFTFNLDGKTEFPTATALGAWTAEQVNTWKNDLLFVQFLKDNKDNSAKFSQALGTVFTTYRDNGYLNNSVVLNGDITCAVKSECTRCQAPNGEGAHQLVYSDPEFGANCQRGPKCMICGKVFGQPSKHNLADVTTFAKGSKLALAWAKLSDKDTGVAPFKGLTTEPKKTASACWLQGGTGAYDTVEICTGCLEAWYDDTIDETTEWNTGKWFTAVQGIQVAGAAKACNKKGATPAKALEDGDLPQDGSGIECAAGHMHYTSIPTDHSKVDFNYLITANAARPDSEVLHTFTLTEGNAKELLTQFKDMFGLTDETIKTITPADAVKKITEKVESYKYTVKDQKSTDTVKVKVDEAGYLVLSWNAELTPDYCQAPSWKEDLCFACALHFAKSNVVDTTIDDLSNAQVKEKEGKFGIRTTEKVVENTHPSTNDGKYASNKEASLHVYAPSKDWTYDPANPTYVKVVCLRCNQWDTRVAAGPVADWVKGHGSSWYYVTTEDEVGKLPVDDAEALKAKFTEKAHTYEDAGSTYNYAATAEAAKEALGADALAEGGVVELAPNLGDVTLTASLTASGKDLEVDLNGNTIKAATVAANRGSVEVGNNGTLTIKGGTIESASTNVIAVTTGALVLEDVTVNATTTNGWGINVNGSAATHVTLKNSTVISAAGAFTVNGSFEGQSIELENCTFLGSTIGIYMAGKAVTTATNCVFYGTVTAADICSGDITFNGCTFANSNFFYGTGTPEAEVPSNFFSGNGSTFPRACSATIVVDAKAGYKKPIALKFTGTSTWINTAMPSYIDAAWKYKVSDMLPEAPDETHTEAFKNALGETIGYYAKATKPYEKICVAVVEPGEYTETRVSINTNVDLGLKLGTNVLVYTSNGSSAQQPAEQATIEKVENLKQLVTVSGCSIAEKTQP